MTDPHDDYEPGDINRLDDGDEDLRDEDLRDDVDADAGNRDAAAHPAAVLAHIATALADEPDQVEVEAEVRGRRATLRLHVAQPDMGRVIGRRGRTAQAIRVLVSAAGARDGLTTAVDIVD